MRIPLTLAPEVDERAPDAGAILHLLEGSVASARRAEAEKFQLALAWAEAHRCIPIGGDRFVINAPSANGVAHEVDVRDTTRLGAYRYRMYRYAIDEFAISLQASSHTTSRYLSNAIDCAFRLPVVYDAAVAGSIEVWVARKLATLTAELSADAVEVNTALEPHLGVLPIGRLLEKAEAAVASADPEGQAAKFDEERNRRLIHLSRVTDGHRTLFIRTDAVSAARFYETATDLAHRLSESESTSAHTPPASMDELRAAAVGLLADPQAALDFLGGKDPRRGKAVVYVHTTAEQLSELPGIAPITRIEDIGPACGELMRDFIGHDHVTVTPVIDLNDQPTAADAYEIPTALARRIHLLNPAETFPYSNTVSRRVDLDHTVPYATGMKGQTSQDNLAPLTRRHHRVKTHAKGWSVQHLGNRAYLWTTPHGRQVIVDPQGTHQVEMLNATG